MNKWQVHALTHPVKFSAGQLCAGCSAKNWAVQVTKEIAVCKRPLSGWETDITEKKKNANQCKPQTPMSTLEGKDKSQNAQQVRKWGALHWEVTLKRLL